MAHRQPLVILTRLTNAELKAWQRTNKSLSKALKGRNNPKITLRKCYVVLTRVDSHHELLARKVPDPETRRVRKCNTEARKKLQKIFEFEAEGSKDGPRKRRGASSSVTHDRKNRDSNYDPERESSESGESSGEGDEHLENVDIKGGSEPVKKKTRPYRRRKLPTPIIRKEDGTTRVKCEICGRELSLWSLESHKQYHEKMKTTKPTDYQCPVCKYSFKFKQNLKKHFVSHLENNPFVCTFPGCSRKFTDGNVLGKHMKLHNSTLNTCDKCKARYWPDKKPHVCKPPSKNKYYTRRIYDGFKVKRVSMEAEKSQDMEQQRKPSPQSEWQGVQPKVERVIELERVHLSDQIILTNDGPVHLKGETLTPILENKLEEAPSASNNVSNPKKTKRSIHSIIINDPVFKRVAKENPGFAKLITGPKCRMLKVEYRNEAFECEKCKRQFSLYWQLEKHSKKCSASKRYPSNNANLNPTPILEESRGKISLICGTCGYKSHSTADLAKHQKTAANHDKIDIIKYKCSVCGYRCKSSKTLKLHKRRIHDTKPQFKCPFCDKYFAANDCRKSHVNRFHRKQDYKFSCHKCGHKYKEKKYLETHKCLVRPICQICGQECCTLQALKVHIYMVHTKRAEAAEDKGTSGTWEGVNLQKERQSDSLKRLKSVSQSDSNTSDTILGL